MYEDKFNQLIRNRKSTVTFSDKPIGEETLVRLFEAARWSPSSRNEQPWRFIVYQKQNTEGFNKIISCLHTANQDWAAYAPMLVLSIAKEQHAYNNKPNEYAVYDVGQAVAYMTLQATMEGVYAHQMAGFDKQKTKELFGIPSGFEPVTVIAFGYLGKLIDFPKNLMAREMQSRSREPIQDIVFANNYGELFL